MSACAATAITLALSAAPAGATILFQDGFESGNLSHTQSGIRWSGSNSGSADDLRVSTQNPRAGSYSLQFTFTGGPAGDDAWSEQRFALGGQYHELWTRYDLYVPANYVHRQDGASNNKFLDFWADPYSPPSFYVNWSTTSNGGGGSDLEIHKAHAGSELPIDRPASGRDFITAQDLGAWHEIVARLKVPTADGANDGIAQMWKDGVQVVDLTAINNWGGTGKNYFDAGYLLGWSNSGFAETTVFYIDNVVFADTPIDTSPAPKPKAPTNLQVQ